MPLPDIQTAPAYDAFSIVYDTDLVAQQLAQQGTGWVSGCAYSLPGGLGVTIASGQLAVAGVALAAAGGSVTLTAASTADRWDLICIDQATGAVVTATAGTPCPVAGWTRNSLNTNSTYFAPEKPAIPANTIPLFAVYRPGGSGSTALSASQVLDMRQPTHAMPVWLEGSGPPTGALGDNGDFYLDRSTASSEVLSTGLTPYVTEGPPSGQQLFGSTAPSSVVSGPPPWALGATGTVNLLDIPAATAGVVDELHLTMGNAGSGYFIADARLQISYDGGTTWPFDVDCGSLFATHYLNAGGPAIASGWTKHWGAQMNTAGGGGSGGWMVGILRFPIYFTNGLIIRLVNTVSSGTTTALFTNVNWQQYPAAVIPPVQLRSTSVTAADPAGSSTNIAGATYGYTLTNPNVAHNGQGGSAFTVAHNQIVQMANLTGKGWVVGIGEMLLPTSLSDLSPLERPLATYVDGATAPSVTSPLSYGAPTWMANGHEDSFGSAWYASVWGMDGSGRGASPYACVIGNPLQPGGVIPAIIKDTSDPNILGGAYHNVSSQIAGRPTWNAFLDTMAQDNGWRFNSSFELWLLTKNPNNTTGSHQMAWAVLYYADLS